MKRRLALVVCCGVMLLTGCDRFMHHDQIRLSGTLELTEHSLGSRVAGRLMTRTVDEGDEVKSGKVIATFDRYDQARRDYNRDKKLFEQGGATQQAVEEAELTLQDEQIVAPLDGVVLTVAHEVGEVVPAGGAVLTLGDRSDIWVRVFVSEGLVNRVKMGQAATVEFDGVTQKFAGHVSYISPMAEFTPRNVQTPEERVTQTFAVKVKVDHPDPTLRPGVAAEVVLPLEKPSL